MADKTETIRRINSEIEYHKNSILESDSNMKIEEHKAQIRGCLNAVRAIENLNENEIKAYAEILIENYECRSGRRGGFFTLSGGYLDDVENDSTMITLCNYLEY